MQPAGPRSRPLDLSALTERVSSRDVGEYYRDTVLPYSRRWWAIASIVGAYLIGQVVFIGFLLPATGIEQTTLRFVFAGFIAFTSVYAALLMALIRRNTSRQVRMWRAASMNGMRYLDRGGTPPLVGTAVNQGGTAVPSDVLVADSASASAVEFTAATFQSRPGFTLRRSGMVQVPLGRDVPNIALVNARASVFGGSGSRFTHEQRLGLEGDFDRTFSLYCPAGYERDALYIFTPDLMAILLDVVSDCEVELVDGHVVIYSGGPWRLWRPERFASVVRIAELLGARAQRRTARYRDDPSTTKRGGGRLRHRPSLGTVVAIGLTLALGVYGVVDLLIP